MRIQIKQKIRPFTHRPGETMLIPGTLVPVQVYPSTLIIEGDSIPLDVEGPIEKFTVINDLERCELRISGFSRTGFFEHRLQRVQPAPMERLSFGCHKKQDWELICRRRDLKEILPIWFAMGQRTNTEKSVEPADFQAAFESAFTGMMVPLAQWDKRFGTTSDVDPEALLKGGAQKIRSLFFQKKQNQLIFLPGQVQAFACGRLISLQEENLQIHIEWSNHKLRRVILEVEKEAEYTFILPNKLKRFRLRQSTRESGFVVNTVDHLFAPGRYLLDRFES